MAGNIYKAKGYINPIIKLEIESVKKIRCVFSYTEQNAVIKYQKNKKIQNEKIKKINTFIFRHVIDDLI